MVLASAVLLAVAPLKIPAGFRTFPEIAALVGQTPTEVKCDPDIAHRAVFVKADSISREGLLQALGLTLIPDGQRKLMQNAFAAQEREWASDVRLALGRRYEHVQKAALEAIARGRIRLSDRNEADRHLKIARDPASTPRERQRADQGYTRVLGAILAYGEGSRQSPAAISALTPFPSAVPAELLERGVVVDTLPLSSLPAASLALLREAYPSLQGTPDSILVRRRRFGDHFSALSMYANLGIVDPGVVVAPGWGISTTALPIGPGNPTAASLLRSTNEGTLRLRLFAAEVAKLRAGEAKGRALVDRLAEEIPVQAPPAQYVLSQVVEEWAKNGHDIIQELDPGSEHLWNVFDKRKLRTDGDWSPQVVEGVLVLRPLLRFINARRRYPFAALFALEAAGARPETQARRNLGYRFPSFEARSAYVRRAGPRDRWESTSYRWESTSYRGWPPDVLDGGASRRRVVEWVPTSVLKEADDLMRQLREKPGKGEVHRWNVPLTSLPRETQNAIVTEMQAAASEGDNALAFVPTAMELFLRQGALRVSVIGHPNAPFRFITVSSDVPVLDGAILYGE